MSRIEIRKLKVNKDDSGSRLDLYISFMNNDWSRSFVKKQIKEGRVTVNEQVEKKANYKVKGGDNIMVNALLEKMPKKIAPEEMKIDVVYEDEDYLVVNKKAGVVVHPATGNWSGTLMNGLVYKYKELSDLGYNLRAGLIHRLDKATSGVILIGKNNRTIWYLSSLFARRKVKKTYLAVVCGDFSKITTNEYKLSTFISRHKGNRKKYSANTIGKGKGAITRFEFLEKSKIDGNIMSTVLAFPETGRTHQIRVHFSHLGHSILGDKVYGRCKYNRMMLHAWKIKFTDMKGKVCEYKANIPNEFKPFTNSIK